MQLSHIRPHAVPIVAGILILALAALGPIAQLANYHDFADQRSLFGIPNAADVLSNIGFLLVGVAGLALVARRRLADLTFFAALALTAFGSAWYHLAPDDARLVWDRLPIALACAALLAAMLCDTYPARVPPRLALGALAAFGVGSVYWWAITGDLRPYLLIQLSPLVLIPLLQWEAGAPVREKRGFAIAIAIALYVLAKVAELADHAIYEALGVISGHTLKHLLATLAACAIALVWRKKA